VEIFFFTFGHIFFSLLLTHSSQIMNPTEGMIQKFESLIQSSHDAFAKLLAQAEARFEDTFQARSEGSFFSLILCEKNRAGKTTCSFSMSCCGCLCGNHPSHSKRGFPKPAPVPAYQPPPCPPSPYQENNFESPPTRDQAPPIVIMTQDDLKRPDKERKKPLLHVAMLSEMGNASWIQAAVGFISQHVGHEYRVVPLTLQEAMLKPNVPLVVIGTRKFRFDELLFDRLFHEIGTARTKVVIICAEEEGAEKADYSTLGRSVDAKHVAFLPIRCTGNGNAYMNKITWNTLAVAAEKIAVTTA
jgi:hypothetical protein